MEIQSTAILGAGGWGTALAGLWAKDGRDIILWGHNATRVEQLRSSRENHEYLPGFKLPETVRVTDELRDCANCSLIVFVIPSTAVRSIAEQFRDIVASEDSVLLSCTKGIEHGTGLRMSEILFEILPRHPIAVLSGPNLAVEVARGLPTATVLGCADAELAVQLQGYLGSPRFRVYTSDELTGIELGGALKNVFALPAGVSDGFGLGDNSKAALVTRSLAELLRIGTAMGGHPRTFYGLSGVGDLIATCFSQHSRNRRVGEKLGRGESLDQIISSMQMVAEGIPTTKSAYECARKLNVETPIIDQVYAVLYEGKAPAQGLKELLQRDQKAERL
ncbi:MAG: Glycerol-3-phosphate dehydrogenase [Spartobacteria bacterium]|nr:Glycerol-3-phosphate dehydrogenase [Spartobacteria bacterium]